MHSALYDLPIPDEQAELDLKDLEPEELAKLLYEQWISRILWDSYGSPDQKKIEANYQIGVPMLRPYREKFKGELRPGQTANTSDRYENWHENGDFLSILLNETGLERLVFDANDFPDRLGYLLKKGKILEINGDTKRPEESRNIHRNIANFGLGGTLINRGYISSAGSYSDLDFLNYGECEYVGMCADGGKWVNYNRIADYFATGAAGGLFINRGISRSFGMKAEGGIGINLGKITQSIAGKAKGGLWINFGEAQSMGSNAKGGIFISTVRVGKSWIKNHNSFGNSANGNAIVIGPSELKMDSELFDLVEAVEQAARAENYEETEQIARKVDEHVRANYKGRKVA